MSYTSNIASVSSRRLFSIAISATRSASGKRISQHGLEQVLINPPVAIGVWARPCWWLETFGVHFMSSSTRNQLKMQIFDFLCTWVLIFHRFPPIYDIPVFFNFRKKSVRRCFPALHRPSRSHIMAYFTPIHVLQHQKPTQNAQFWLLMHLGNDFPSFPTILRLFIFSTKFWFFSVRRSSSTSTQTGAYNHTASTAFGKLGPLETRKLLDKFSSNYAGSIQNLILYRLVYSKSFDFYKICKSKRTPLQPLKIFIEISNKISSKFASHFFRNFESNFPDTGKHISMCRIWRSFNPAHLEKNLSRKKSFPKILSFACQKKEERRRKKNFRAGQGWCREIFLNVTCTFLHA